MLLGQGWRIGSENEKVKTTQAVDVVTSDLIIHNDSIPVTLYALTHCWLGEQRSRIVIGFTATCDLDQELIRWSHVLSQVGI